MLLLMWKQPQHEILVFLTRLINARAATYLQIEVILGIRQPTVAVSLHRLSKKLTLHNNACLTPQDRLLPPHLTVASSNIL